MGFLFFISDGIICVSGYGLAVFLRSISNFYIFKDVIPYERLELGFINFFIVLLAQYVSFYFFGLYDKTNENKYIYNLKDIILACVVSVILVIVIVYFMSAHFFYQRSVLVVYAVIQITLISLSRKLITVLSRTEEKPKNIVIIGDIDIAESIIIDINTNPYLKKYYNVSGILLPKKNTDQENNSYKSSLVKILGYKDDIENVIKNHKIDEVLILSKETWQSNIINKIDNIFHKKNKDNSPEVSIVPSAYEIKIGKINFKKIHDIPMFNIYNLLSKKHFYLIKRSFDIFFSIMLMLITLPITILTTLLIITTSKGSPLYFQRRVGKDMKRFTIVKFRTMYSNAERRSGIKLSPDKDKRLTPIGKYLRILRIDELPQLFNVLKGDMSFVGPRPERMFFVKGFIKDIPSYKDRFKIKPGLTGLAQIHGSYHTRAEIKLKYDLSYIYNWSIILEIRILLETIKVILTRKGH